MIPSIPDLIPALLTKLPVAFSVLNC